MNAIAENIRGFSDQTKMIAIGAVVVMFMFMLMMGASNMSGSSMMSPLYASVEQSDTQHIIQELQRSGIAYEMGNNGTQLLVPTDKLLQIRMLLAQKGLPSGGSNVGYEIFDKTDSLGTSSFVLNVNKLRALEGELGRTISSFAKVDSARIHLVIPKRELFSRQKMEATASVSLKVISSELSKQEIAAISHLVATAVPGLKPKNITIVDDRGRLLARGMDDENDIGYLASISEEYRISYEYKTKNMLEKMLEKIIGEGSVRAEVSANIDFDRIVTNSEIFDPEGQVVRSVQATEEVESSNESESSDNVSAGNNLPDSKADEGGLSANRKLQRTDETTNFEISKTVKEHIKETGTVKRLSVAILIDGIYSENDNGDVIYAPRSETAIAQISKLVKSAIGYDEKRGDTVEVVNMEFIHRQEDLFEESPLQWLQDDLESIIQTVVLGGISILVILLIIRPLVSRAIAASQVTQEEEDFESALLSGTGIMGQIPDLTEEDDEEMITISRVTGGIRSSTFRKISDLIEAHPDESLNVIRQWAFMPSSK